MRFKQAFVCIDLLLELFNLLACLMRVDRFKWRVVHLWTENAIVNLPVQFAITFALLSSVLVLT